MKLKYFLTEVDQRLNGESLPLMSVSKIQGVVPRSDLMGDSGRAESIDHYKKCLPGDLVINRMAAYQGAVGIAPMEGAVSPDYSVVRGPQELVNFLFYFLKSELGLGLVTSLLKGIGSIDSGAVRTPRLNWKDLAEVSIEFAPNHELVEAVNYLDQETSQIGLLISKKEQLIEKLLERRQALITRAVTKGLDPNVPMKDSGVEWLGQVPDSWEVIPLKRLVKLNTETLNESTDPSEEIHYIEIGNVSLAAGIEAWATMRYGDAPARARRVVREGDVLISTVRTYLKAIGRVVSIPTDGELVASTGFAALRPVGVDSRFLELAIASDSFIGKIQENSVGVSYPGIDASKLISFKIALPPTAEQNVISNFLDAELGQISELINRTKSAIELLRERRQALITQVVTGKLDVRGFASGNS